MAVPAAARLLAVASLAWLAASSAAAGAEAITPPTGDEAARQAGQRLYRHGIGRDGRPLQAQVGVGVSLQGPAVACARCHGLAGGGSRDAGQVVPPLQWTALTRERPASPGRLPRPAYDETRLLRALRDGIDAGGQALGAAMPRFSLSPREAADLVQHLRLVGTEAERQPGVTSDRVVLATVLPRGAAETVPGRAVLSGARACLERANRSGGVYGRQLVLQVHEAPVDTEALGEAAARWSDQALMLVAPWWPRTEAEPLAAAVGPLPVLGPLGAAAELGGASPWWFGIAPQLGDQARVLVDHAAAALRATGRPLLLIAADDAPSRTGMRAAEQQAGLHEGLQLIVRSVDGPSDVAAAAREAADAGAVLALLPPPLLRQVVEGTAATRPTIFALLQQLGSAPLAWPAAQRDRLRVATATPDAEEFDPRAMHADLRALGAPPGPPALQAPAYAAGCAAVEALRAAGRTLDRERLVQGLESVQGLATGVLPRISFGPRQRHGVWQARLLRVADDGSGYLPEAGWSSPRLPS